MRLVLLLTTLVFSLCGCTAARRVGGALGTAALGTTAFDAEGLLNGMLDDEPHSDQLAKEDRELYWKQYWRTNPNVNPAMTKEFAND